MQIFQLTIIKLDKLKKHFPGRLQRFLKMKRIKKKENFTVRNEYKNFKIAQNSIKRVVLEFQGKDIHFIIIKCM